MLRIIILLLLCICLTSKNVFAEVPIDIDLNQGGAITRLLVEGQNAVDTYDCGRLIQLALYDNAMPVTTAGTCFPSNPGYTFAWDPVQACDGCQPAHSSEILDGSDKTYIKVRPKLWVGNGVAGDFVIEQRITQTEFSNAVKVAYKIKHEGNDYHKKLDIELPATWIQNRFSKFFYYNGIHPWTNDVLNQSTTDVNPITPWLGTESWGALIDPSNSKGIGIYNPSSVNAIEFLTDPAHGSSNPRYSTSWLSVVFPPTSELSFDVYFLTGTVDEIRNTIYQLPRNSNYLVEPSNNTYIEANAGETYNLPVKITNRSLVAFYKDDQTSGIKKTMVGIERRLIDGLTSETVAWISLASDIPPGQSITMNLPVRMPATGGQYKYFFNVIYGLEMWMTSSGFPVYPLNVNVNGPSPSPTPSPTTTPITTTRPINSPNLNHISVLSAIRLIGDNFVIPLTLYPSVKPTADTQGYKMRLVVRDPSSPISIADFVGPACSDSFPITNSQVYCSTEAPQSLSVLIPANNTGQKKIWVVFENSPTNKYAYSDPVSVEVSLGVSASDAPCGSVIGAKCCNSAGVFTCNTINGLYCGINSENKKSCLKIKDVQSDLNLWSNTFGTNDSALDFDNNGVVQDIDYVLWIKYNHSL